MKNVFRIIPALAFGSVAQTAGEMQDVQKAIQRGHSEREAEAHPLRYVEALRDARTKLEAFFNILLELTPPISKGVEL